MNQLPNRLKILILEKGYKIKEVAELLNMNDQTISNWCNGKGIDNIKKFSELCIILDIQPKDIFPDIKKQE